MKALCIGIVLMIVGFASCHFQSPNPAEQRVLVERKMFPAGVPLWVSSGVEGAEGARSGGQLSDTLEAPVAVLERQNEGRAMIEVAPTPLPKSVQEEKSPIVRINQLCPGIESQVSAALTTVEVDERIARYEMLSRECPASSDLWLWLAQDYNRAGRLSDAQQAYRRTLAIDANNEQAKQGLEKLERTPRQ